ncbi:MAG: myristoyl transferase, partial [Acidimicrobiia bacterium]|nr:myristoyl transferase [Acidimicrobiia bacterium]
MTPRRRTRPLLSGLVTLVALLVAAACGGDDGEGGAAGGTNAAPARRVTVVLDWTPNTNHSGVYLARSTGRYEEAGLDVEIVEPGQDGALSQIAAGNGEFGFSVAESILPARAQGVPVVSLAAVIAHNTSSLVAPADRGITRPADLQGKTYGGFGGELERALVEDLVRCDGGDPSTVRFVEVGNVDYRVGFDRGDFDFVWVFDGWDTIRLADIGGMDVTTIPFVEHTECIPDWYTPVIATNESLVSQDPELVRA